MIRFQSGDLRLTILSAGTLWLDGGAMFGVVPKALWERRIPADERNRIPLALRCLLVEHDDGLVLIDTGIGNKENEKIRDIYGVEAIPALEQALEHRRGDREATARLTRLRESLPH